MGHDSCKWMYCRDGPGIAVDSLISSWVLEALLSQCMSLARKKGLEGGSNEGAMVGVLESPLARCPLQVKMTPPARS